MAEQGDNKDALLDKLDNLMRSGRAPKRDDPPPLLTDPIPGASESAIPTLTDIVSTPDTIPEPDATTNTGDASAKVATGPTDDAPLEFEPLSTDKTDRDTPLEFERIEVSAGPQQGPENLEQQAPAEDQGAAPDDRPQQEADDTGRQTPTVLHESISERLLDVLDREMSSLLKDLPSEKSKLSVLHRSLRFALPELVRLRWLEPPADGSEGDSEPED